MAIQQFSLECSGEQTTGSMGQNEINEKAPSTRREAERMVNDYLRYLELSEPEVFTVALDEPPMSQARIIRHLPDVPVLAAALKAAPDWVLSLNRKHSRRT